MKRSRLSEEQVIGVPREPEAGATVAELCRKHEILSAAFNAWKAEVLPDALFGREAVAHLRESLGMSERWACKTIAADRTTRICAAGCGNSPTSGGASATAVCTCCCAARAGR